MRSYGKLSSTMPTSLDWSSLTLPAWLAMYKWIMPKGTRTSPSRTPSLDYLHQRYWSHDSRRNKHTTRQHHITMAATMAPIMEAGKAEKRTGSIILQMADKLNSRITAITTTTMPKVVATTTTATITSILIWEKEDTVARAVDGARADTMRNSRGSTSAVHPSMADYFCIPRYHQYHAERLQDTLPQTSPSCATSLAGPSTSKG